jgi:UDP-glucuronate decarboxylase
MALEIVLKLQKKIILNLFFLAQVKFMEILILEYVPTKETYRGNVSTLGPRACYDESKRLGETLVLYL